MVEQEVWVEGPSVGAAPVTYVQEATESTLSSAPVPYDPNGDPQQPMTLGDDEEIVQIPSPLARILS